MSNITLESLRQKRGLFALKIQASTCIPCKQMSLFDEKICKELNIELLHIDASLPMVMKLGIRSIPSYVIFRDGQIIKSKSGFMNATKFREFLCDSVSG